MRRPCHRGRGQNVCRCLMHRPVRAPGVGRPSLLAERGRRPTAARTARISLHEPAPGCDPPKITVETSGDRTPGGGPMVWRGAPNQVVGGGRASTAESGSGRNAIRPNGVSIGGPEQCAAAGGGVAAGHLSERRHETSSRAEPDSARRWVLSSKRGCQAPAGCRSWTGIELSWVTPRRLVN